MAWRRVPGDGRRGNEVGHHDYLAMILASRENDSGMNKTHCQPLWGPSFGMIVKDIGEMGRGRDRMREKKGEVWLVNTGPFRCARDSGLFFFVRWRQERAGILIEYLDSYRCPASTLTQA